MPAFVSGRHRRSSYVQNQFDCTPPGERVDFHRGPVFYALLLISSTKSMVHHSEAMAAGPVSPARPRRGDVSRRGSPALMT